MNPKGGNFLCIVLFPDEFLRISIQNIALEEKTMSQYYAKISEIEYLKEFGFCKVAWPFCILYYFPVTLS